MMRNDGLMYLFVLVYSVIIIERCCRLVPSSPRTLSTCYANKDVHVQLLRKKSTEW